MKNVSILLALMFCVSSYAQNLEELGYEFNEYSNTYSKTDSIIVLTENSPLPASAIELIYIDIGYNSVSVMFRNKADDSIYSKHIGYIRNGEHYQPLTENDAYELRPEKIAIGDCASLHLHTFSYSDKFGPSTKELKKQYATNKKDITLHYRLSIPIIYKERRIDFCIYQTMIYRGKQKSGE